MPEYEIKFDLIESFNAFIKPSKSQKAEAIKREVDRELTLRPVLTKKSHAMAQGKY